MNVIIVSAVSAVCAIIGWELGSRRMRAQRRDALFAEARTEVARLANSAETLRTLQ